MTNAGGDKSGLGLSQQPEREGQGWVIRTRKDPQQSSVCNKKQKSKKGSACIGIEWEEEEREGVYKDGKRTRQIKKRIYYIRKNGTKKESKKLMMTAKKVTHIKS